MNELIPAEQPSARSRIGKVSTDLGLIFAPATLIGIIGALSNLSNATTAAISLGAAYLIMVFLYRSHWRKLLVTGAIATVGLAVWGGLIRFSDGSGYLRTYPKSNDFLGREFDKQLRATKREVWFFGFDFFVHSDQSKDVILERLRDGVRIRYLVFDPTSKKIGEVAKAFAVTPQNIPSQAESALQSLLELQRLWIAERPGAKNPGSIEIRVFDEMPVARFYGFDPQSENGKIYFVPYINRGDSVALPGILFSTREPTFHSYFAAVQNLWDQSRPVATPGDVPIQGSQTDEAQTKSVTKAAD